MYLLTTAGEVDLVEVEAELVGDASRAAIVLPVPESPANSAVSAAPQRRVGAEAPLLIDDVLVEHVQAISCSWA